MILAFRPRKPQPLPINASSLYNVTPSQNFAWNTPLKLVKSNHFLDCDNNRVFWNPTSSGNQSMEIEKDRHRIGEKLHPRQPAIRKKK